ncbi:hypothetical protein PV723_09250, partial [Streptomyces sp. AK04-3B]|nr:hypothetical protein [Streptomyces sp. AK04-3B]
MSEVRERRAGRRSAMVLVASVVVALGAAAGMVTALGDGDERGQGRDADGVRPRAGATLLSPSPPPS